MKYTNRIRAKIEINEKLERMLSVITNSLIYKRCIYSLVKKKTEKVKRLKEYGFAIEVSSLCNARCSFCPNSKMKRKKEIMSNDLFDLIIKKIKEEKITPRYFNLTGTGEPLLDKNLFYKIKVIKNNFPNSFVFFPSNFSIAGRDIVDKILTSGLDQIIISLNASNPTDYMKIMGLNYKNTIKNFKYLIKERNKRNSKLKIHINIAANKINSKEINLFVKKWEKLVDDISVNWIHSWAGAVENSSIRSKDLKTRYPCKSLFDQIVIQSNGSVPLCCVDYEKTTDGGNIEKLSILEAFYSKKINKIRKYHLEGKINKLDMCRLCRFSEKGLDWLAK